MLLQAELLFNKNLPEGRLESVLGYLETRLAANPFVAGGDCTVGDVAVASLPALLQGLLAARARALTTIG